MNDTEQPVILVVDDTRANLHFLVETLTEQGYMVRPTPDGELALASAQAEPPDLILLDIMMPGMDGYEVCRALKAQDHTRDIPVIFLSALSEAPDKAKAFAVGGVDFIAKPFQVEEVLARVNIHLALRGLQQDLQARNSELARANEDLARANEDLARTNEGLANEVAGHKQAEQALHLHAERLEIQKEIGQSILAAQLPETIAVAAISRIQHLIPFRHAIVLDASEGGELSMLAARSQDETGPLVDVALYQEVLQEPVLKQFLVQGVMDLAVVTRRSPLKQALYAAGVRSYVIVPLFIQGELIGTMHMESNQPRAFAPEHITIATEVAASLAVAIRQARLYEQGQREIVERKQSERQIRQQKELLENVIESLSHPFCVIRVDSFLVEVANSAALKFARNGEPPTCYTLNHRRDRPCDGMEHPCPLQQVLRTKMPVTVEHLHYGEHGEARYMEVRGHPLFDTDGNVVRMIEYSLDITDRKQAEEAMREAAAAAERDRLASELHDAVTQMLFSASLIAEALPALQEHNPEEAKRSLDKLRRLTRGALAEMRTLLLELRPVALTEKPLADLLRHLSGTLTSRTGIPVGVTIEDNWSIGTLPPDVQVALYRIAQESLNNIAKHAHASQANLVLRLVEGRADLGIGDDGRGFDPGAIPPGHLGVDIMRERAAKIGATFALASEPGEGTQVRVVWTEEKESAS